jgi:RimJ/RimL family protein N-acetyltransferase
MNQSLKRLDGTRLYLRPLELQDADLILRWRSLPDVANQLFSEHPPTRAEHEAWYSRLQESDDRIEFIIVALEGEVPIGTIGLSSIDRENGEAEYGILIGDAKWRGIGMASEASEVIFRYAFESLGLQKIRLSLFADNSSARALYDLLGFVENPLQVGKLMKNGFLRVTTIMYITRGDYFKKAGSQ